MKTSRLREPLSIVEIFSPSLREVLQKYPDLVEVPGTYELDGDVIVQAGPQMTYEGKLGMTAARWRSYSVDVLAAEAQWSGGDLELNPLKITRGPETVEGSLSLALSTQEHDLPDFSFRGKVHRVSVDSLKNMGLHLEGEPQGTVGGTGTLSYKQGAWEAAGELSIEQGSVYGEAFETLRGRVKLAGGLLQITEGQATRGTAKATIGGQVLWEKREMNLTVRIVGFPVAEFAPLREKKVELEGRLSASGEIRGMLDNP